MFERLGIRLLGHPAVLSDGDRVLPFPSRGLVLLSWLALTTEGRRVARVEAAAAVWPDADLRVATVNLRQLLARVAARQREMGMAPIRYNTVSVWLDRFACAIDLLRFEEEAGAATPSAAVLLACYQGDLLAGETDGGGHGPSWLAVHRARLRGAFFQAAGRALEADTDRDAGRALAHRMIEIDPYQEAAYRHLMRAYAADRQFAQVREIYERCHRRLSLDLGVDPDSTTLDLLRRIFGGHTIERPAEDAAPAPVRAPRTSVPVGTGTPRLTLLPPAAEAGDAPAQLASMLIEDVTVALCGLRKISIVAPHTAWYVARQVFPEESFERFGIDYVAATRIHRADGEPHLYISLYGTRSREILWADRFPIQPETAAGNYTALLSRIVTILAAEVERDMFADAMVASNPTAYHHYLRGRRALAQLDLKAVRRARREFRDALADAPYFVPAIAGIARSLHREWLLRARCDDELLAAAEGHARRAIEIDDRDHRGYRELALVQNFRGEFDDAQHNIRRAVGNSPQYADVIADWADILVHGSRVSDGLARIEEAMAMNPMVPDEYHWTRAGALYCLGRYGEALEEIARMQSDLAACRLAAACWAMNGNERKARSYVDRTREEHPDFSVREWLRTVPLRESWQRSMYREGLLAAGFN